MPEQTSAQTSAQTATVHTVRRPRLEKLVSQGLSLLERISPAIAGRIAFQMFLTPLRNYFPVCPKEEAVLEQGESRILRYGLYRRHYLQTFSWTPEEATGEEATILLIHGWMASASHMSGFVQPLLDAGFRVIAMDAPAHGRSSGFQTSMPEFGEAICQVVKELGPVDGIVGHSFGAASSLFLLHYHPNAIAINSLVTLASPNQVTKMMQIIVKGLGGSDRLREEMEKCFIKRYSNPVDYYAIENMVVDNPLPGLVVHDRSDGLIGFEAGEAIAAAWPGAQFIATDGLGHGGVQREPELIQKIVQFHQNHCQPDSAAKSEMSLDGVAPILQS